MKATLRSYQKKGVTRLHDLTFRKQASMALLADSAGLGKTVISLKYWENYFRGSGRCVVVCPSSLKSNWEANINKFFVGKKAVAIDFIDSASQTPRPTSEIILISYEFFSRGVVDKPHLYQRDKRSLFIFDEAHYLKNYKAKRTVYTEDFARRHASHSYFICLTGTPFSNSVADLYTLLHTFDRKELYKMSRITFLHRFSKTVAEWNGHLTCRGVDNIEELKKLLKDVMIRRTRAEVLTELPPLNRIPITIDTRNFPKSLTKYFKEMEVMFHEGIANVDSEPLKFTRQRRAVGIAKVKEIADTIKDSIYSGEKLLIYTCFRDTATSYVEKLGESDCTLITGSVNSDKRFDIINTFLADPAKKYLVATIGSLKEGLDLQAMSSVLFTELDWSYINHIQAEARVQRFGQKNQVNSFYFVADRGMDRHVFSTLEEKGDSFSKILGDDD